MNFFGTHINKEKSLIDLIKENTLFFDANSNEYMCKFSSDIIKNYTEMWVYNRKLNVDKIKNIEKQLRDKTILETVLYLIYNKDHNKLIVFDGNHRRQALINRYKVTGIDVCVFSYIYIINDDFDTKEFHDKVYEKFKIINNNTPIPELCYQILENTLYKDNQEDLNLLYNRQNIIENLLLEFKNKYSKFYSLSSNCYKPNFNDTKFYKLCDTEFKTKEELLDKLNTINEFNKSKRDTVKLCDKTLKKCIKYNFYLFII